MNPGLTIYFAPKGYLITYEAPILLTDREGEPFFIQREERAIYCKSRKELLDKIDKVLDSFVEIDP